MERLVGKYLFDPEISAGKMVFLTGPRQVGKTTLEGSESLFTRSSTVLEGAKHFRAIVSKFLHPDS